MNLEDAIHLLESDPAFVLAESEYSDDMSITGRRMAELAAVAEYIEPGMGERILSESHTTQARIVREWIAANRARGHVPELRQGPNWSPELESRCGSY